MVLMGGTRRTVLAVIIGSMTAGCLNQGDESFNKAFLSVGSFTDEQRVGTTVEIIATENTTRRFELEEIKENRITIDNPADKYHVVVNFSDGRQYTHNWEITGCSSFLAIRTSDDSVRFEESKC